jgi:hypothetical protein
MRFFAVAFVTGLLAVAGCAGDSSSIMSVWNDSGAGNAPGLGGNLAQSGGAGGAGGQGFGGQVVSAGGKGGGVTIPLGGSGGQPSNGTIPVAGGARDLTTAQCISATGGTCPVSSSYLTCLEGNCGTNLTTCYYSDGISRAAGGVCQSYANCMLGCSCDASRSKCEDACLQNHATANPDCSTCLFNLVSCASKYSCPTMTSCSLSAP